MELSQLFNELCGLPGFMDGIYDERSVFKLIASNRDSFPEIGETQENPLESIDRVVDAVKNLRETRYHPKFGALTAYEAEQLGQTAIADTYYRTLTDLISARSFASWVVEGDLDVLSPPQKALDDYNPYKRWLEAMERKERLEIARDRIDLFTKEKANLIRSQEIFQAYVKARLMIEGWQEYISKISFT